MHPIQTVTVVIYFLAMLFAFLMPPRGYRRTILGTGGTIVLPTLVVVSFLVFRVPFGFNDNPLVLFLGLILVCLGILISWSAKKQLGENLDEFWNSQHIQKERSLVTRGIYGKIRHPIYTASFLVYTGLLLNLFHPLAALLVLVYLGVLVFTAIQEERFLRKSFGDEYGRYAQKTGRFLPRLIKQ